MMRKNSLNNNKNKNNKNQINKIFNENRYFKHKIKFKRVAQLNLLMMRKYNQKLDKAR